MKSSMTMEVEFLAGTSISDAVNQAKMKAITFDLAFVEFKFNEVKMCISQNASVDEAIYQFNRCVRDQFANNFIVL